MNDHSLQARICGNHNVSRWADTDEARRTMLIEMNHVTKGRTRRMVESIPWKAPAPEWSWYSLTGEA